MFIIKYPIKGPIFNIWRERRKWLRRYKYNQNAAGPNHSRHSAGIFWLFHRQLWVIPKETALLTRCLFSTILTEGHLEVSNDPILLRDSC